jgi:AcrR family transcriptional regulator
VSAKKAVKAGTAKKATPAKKRGAARRPAKRGAATAPAVTTPTTSPASRRAAVGGPGSPAQGRELRARGQRTMRKLLDAGIEVFAARGYHAARVDDVVKAARTSHGTFYLYFANKEDLFQALVDDVADQMTGLARSLGPVTADDAGRAELRSWLDRFTELYLHYGPVLRTWTEAEIDASEMGRVGTDLLGELAVALAGAVDQRSVVDIDPTIATVALVAMVERFNYFVLSDQVDAHRDEMLDTLSGAMHRGVFGPLD